jgi:hypothetical protein
MSKLNEILSLLSPEDKAEVMLILSDGQVQTAEAQKLIGIALKAVLVQLSKPKPTPKPVPTSELPDDTIPEPKKPEAPAPVAEAPSSVAGLRLKVKQIQLNRGRFPEAYTEDNPFGLVRGQDKLDMESGAGAIPFKSKVWLDLTPVDEFGEEIGPEEVKALGLAWEPVWNVDGVSVGAKAPGVPDVKGESAIVGTGVTNWQSTLGFGLQIQVFEEGTFVAQAMLAGVESNALKLRVS